MADLRIPLKGEYFDQIKAGSKQEEYRQMTSYWAKRLIGRRYQKLILTRGYPKHGDADRHLELPYRGFNIKIINHPHFGEDPVRVFAINVKHQPPLERTLQ